MEDLEQREMARKHLEGRRDFRTHVAVYVIVNAMLVGIWAISGAGYFWPMWPLLGWGVGLAIHAWSTFFEKPISEEDIQREMYRTRR